MRGFGKIFSFTFLQHVKTKSYKTATILGTMICVLLPALIMPAVEYFGKADDYVSAIRKVYVVDEDSGHPADYEVLNGADGERFYDLTYEKAEDIETASAAAEQDRDAVILVVTREGERYQANVLLPEETDLVSKDAQSYESFLSSYFRYILVQKSGLASEQIAELTTPIVTGTREYSGSALEETDAYAGARSAFAVILPYLNIMILYFVVLAYGQGTANSVIMEKTSKLMDLFLVSVRPGEMLLGKVFAVTLSAILQLFFWIGGLIAGFALGTFFTRTVNPHTDMALIQLFDSFGELSGMFTLPGLLIALLMLAAGLLLYSSLAAIGGALAGKPEELSSTNMLFVLVLIVSFFATMYAGGMDADTPWQAASSWQNWVPFTAILIMPTKLILGSVTVLEGLLSTLLVIAAAVVITLIAGKLYRMMSLYKGNPPGPDKILKMLRGRE